MPNILYSLSHIRMICCYTLFLAPGNFLLARRIFWYIITKDHIKVGNSDLPFLVIIYMNMVLFSQTLLHLIYYNRPSYPTPVFLRVHMFSTQYRIICNVLFCVRIIGGSTKSIHQAHNICNISAMFIACFRQLVSRNV